MPSHRTHKIVTKLILSEEYPDVHHWIDEPVKLLGFQHRVLRHSPLELMAKYGSDPKRLAAAVIHVATDFAVTEARKELRKQIRRRV